MRGIFSIQCASCSQMELFIHHRQLPNADHWWPIQSPLIHYLAKPCRIVPARARAPKPRPPDTVRVGRTFLGTPRCRAGWLAGRQVGRPQPWRAEYLISRRHLGSAAAAAAAATGDGADGGGGADGGDATHGVSSAVVRRPCLLGPGSMDGQSCNG